MILKGGILHPCFFTSSSGGSFYFFKFYMSPFFSDASLYVNWFISLERLVTWIPIFYLPGRTSIFVFCKGQPGGRGLYPALSRPKMFMSDGDSTWCFASQCVNRLVTWCCSVLQQLPLAVRHYVGGLTRASISVRQHGARAPLERHLTLRRLTSYIYGAPILDVSRSHTATQHSR